jgi:hypothetical protein
MNMESHLDKPAESYRNPEEASIDEQTQEILDPADSRLLRDQLKGQTTEHAVPPRLEDEGQSGG